MREIKFRAIHKSSNTMVYGNLLVGVDFDGDQLVQIEHTDPQDFQQWTVIPETVGQYTGLKDKNGKEIYEGDIVYVKQNIYAQKHLTVEWGVDRWEFKEEFDNGDYYYGYAIRWEEVEVICNIYENPELLEGK